MLWWLFAILLVVWLLGLVTQVGGGLIHILLVAALVVLVIRLIGGARVT
ncbi:MAG: lmo0937 family membrane protein [Armatimonadetes bacterium]|nr:lmo0937 family membrane protein [Armatimonadota bacterium]